ncbi:MAG TPA: hypothetical protein VFZ64_09580 [Nocardioidaceae bacterium]
MFHALDVELTDTELTSEIELLTDLMVLASSSATALDPGMVDAALGVSTGRQTRMPEQRAAS